MKNRILAFAAASLLALGFAQAMAQYPPPIGNIAAQPTNPNPKVNQDAPLVVTVQSESGVAAASVACTASMASQPGNDARVSPASFTTDSAGTANLTVHTGSTAGQVKVSVNCGALSTLAVMEVQGALAQGDAPRPPNTGTGGTATTGPSNDTAPWILGALVAMAAATGFAARRKFHNS